MATNTDRSTDTIGIILAYSGPLYPPLVPSAASSARGVTRLEDQPSAETTQAHKQPFKPQYRPFKPPSLVPKPKLKRVSSNNSSSPLAARTRTRSGSSRSGSVSLRTRTSSRDSSNAALRRRLSSSTGEQQHPPSIKSLHKRAKKPEFAGATLSIIATVRSRKPFVSPMPGPTKSSLVASEPVSPSQQTRAQQRAERAKVERDVLTLKKALKIIDDERRAADDASDDDDEQDGAPSMRMDAEEGRLVTLARKWRSAGRAAARDLWSHSHAYRALGANSLDLFGGGARNTGGGGAGGNSWSWGWGDNKGNNGSNDTNGRGSFSGIHHMGDEQDEKLVQKRASEVARLTRSTTDEVLADFAEETRLRRRREEQDELARKRKRAAAGKVEDDDEEEDHDVSKRIKVDEQGNAIAVSAAEDVESQMPEDVSVEVGERDLDEEDKAPEWDMGTLVRLAGVDPGLLGWNASKGDFDDELDNE